MLLESTPLVADPDVSRQICQLGNVREYEIHLDIRSLERCDWVSRSGFSLEVRKHSRTTTFSFRNPTGKHLDDMQHRRPSHAASVVLMFVLTR